MADGFTFAMGEHQADFPGDRSYAKNHMWAMADADGWRFGLTAYAVRLLQDVYFLDWLIGSGDKVASSANIGSIESKKAESDLFAPVAGTVSRINDGLLDDPSIINADTYGEGWMFAMRIAAPDAEALLTPDQYADHLADAWQVAQRTIKGQANL